MTDQIIKCDNCGNEIKIEEALTKQIKSSLNNDFDKKVAEKTKQIVSEQTQDLRNELNEKNAKLLDANKKELELLKQQRQIEEKTQNLELEVERKLASERKRIFDEISQKSAEENMLKMREKDDQFAAMKKQIDELKRKAEVGSQEAQGEALEGALKDSLQQIFPYDDIQEVKRGIKGADVLQKVFHNNKECGSILWEAKNTKEFQKKWIDKLKQDQQDAKADIAVIISIVLPKEIKNFDKQDDIWITDYKSTIGLSTALRQTLILVTKEKTRIKYQNSMKDVVYEYITGNEFSMRIKQIVAAYVEMQSDIETEKRSLNRIWAKREKQNSLVLENLSGIRGEIEGMVGQKSLPEINNLLLVEPENN